MKNNSVLDNTTSEFVTLSTGIDFSQISSDTNGKEIYMLSSTKNASHPIYYYRGAVENNNVKFANFCWKIVKSTETGEIKLIYNGVPDSNGACNNTGDAATIGTSSFNKSTNDNAYVGYMYGTVGSSSYDETHKNSNDSAIKTLIDEWYKKNMASYTEKLEDTVWCNDRSLSSGTGVGTTATNYGTQNRLYTNKTPSLECKNQNDKFTVNTSNGNVVLTYPFAMLTADEMAYAGGVWNITNKVYYLYTGSWYWSLSPCIFSTGPAMFNLRVPGNLNNDFVDYTSGGVRPSISLKSDSSLIDGDGSVNTPFVVK